MRYHERQEIFLIDGEQLNQCIWACEQVMDILGMKNEDMLIRFGRLRERLIAKQSYTQLLDMLGIPQAPPAEDVSFAEFLDKLGLKPYQGDKNEED